VRILEDDEEQSDESLRIMEREEQLWNLQEIKGSPIGGGNSGW
jgi:hypothetical protein